MSTRRASHSRRAHCQAAQRLQIPTCSLHQTTYTRPHAVAGERISCLITDRITEHRQTGIGITAYRIDRLVATLRCQLRSISGIRIGVIGAANAAVAALVPTLASELRPLRVNGVSPGVIDTPWWDFLSEEDKSTVFDEYAGKTPVGRVGKSDDIAEAIRFFIMNTFVT
ncbi:SDR family NAD(P)-dependent oxidoreductase [Yersinia enterocolitica]|nr:SDR family NAD(P)-dependent oxidoreductase [Yersinia enterocolitica]HDZ9657889.1 SDR family oxidoreductase [Yersinia enterocolitica]